MNTEHLPNNLLNNSTSLTLGRLRLFSGTLSLHYTAMASGDYCKKNNENFSNEKPMTAS
jgi:hypothetical protein